MPQTTTTPSGSCDGVPMLILMALACSLIALVTFTAALDSHVSRDDTLAAGSELTSNHLPSKCRQYLNDGSDYWVVCMGVEPK